MSQRERRSILQPLSYKAFNEAGRNMLNSSHDSADTHGKPAAKKRKANNISQPLDKQSQLTLNNSAISDSTGSEEGSKSPNEMTDNDEVETVDDNVQLCVNPEEDDLGDDTVPNLQA